MSYYKVCPHCGAHLDPCEVCDCIKGAASGAPNTEGGKAESKNTNESTPIVPGGERSCQV